MKFVAIFALLLLSISAHAKGSAQRFPASDTGLDFSVNAPEIQGVADDEALKLFESLRAAEGFDSTDKKNLEEFKVLGASLESRGYIPLEKRLGGNLMMDARSFSFSRKSDEKVPSLKGRPAYTGLMFEYFYKQTYVEKSANVGAGTALPLLVLHGAIFLRCQGKEKSCPVSGISVHDAEIEWTIPASTRGAESSAGGVKPTAR